MSASRLATALLAATVLTSAACSGCKRDEARATEGSSGAGGASPAASVEVGDRLHEPPAPVSAADLEGYPVPVPVTTVGRESDVPRLPAISVGRAEDASTPRGANKAVEIAVLGVTQTKALPGLRAPEGREFVVLHTRWKNIHPKALLSPEDLQPDRTMGVGKLGSGGRSARSTSSAGARIEADVAFQVPKIEDHAWLVADGAAAAVDVATPRLHLGAPYGRPITLPRMNDTRDLRLAYLVPEGAKTLGLRFFDTANGHIQVRVRGDAERAQGAASLPADASARGKLPELEVAVTSVRELPAYRSVAAPEGWRFVQVGLAGIAAASPQGAAIVQLDPRRFVWLTTTEGQVRFASGGSVSPLGLLRFPPSLLQEHTVVFAVPKGAELSTVSVRSGPQVATLPLGKRVALPPAKVSAADGNAMEVRVLGLWRGAGARENELVMDLVVENRVRTQGLELSSRRFSVAVDSKVLQVDDALTDALVLRPPSPFVVPPGAIARFQLAFATSAVPSLLVVDGVQQPRLELALAKVKESEAEPLHGDPTRRGDELLERVVLPSDEDEEASPTTGPALAFARPIAEGPAVSEPAPAFPDDREPNDSSEKAGLLGDDREATGTFRGGSSFDLDVYRITVTGDPGLYTLEAEGPGLVELGYQGMSRNNRLSARGKDRIALPDLELHPGDHFVQVHGSVDEKTPASSAYRVRLVPQGARAVGSEGEPNDTGQRGMRLTFGETRRGRIGHAGDKDVYVFSLVKAEPVSIQLRGAADAELRMDLESPGIRRNAWSADKGAVLDYRTVLHPGDYELTVRSHEAVSSPYSLTLQPLDPFATGGDLEPNDDLESASPLPPDGVLVGTASKSSDIDVFALPEGEGELVVTPAGSKVHLSVRGRTGSWVELAPAVPGAPSLRAPLPKGPAFLRVDTGAPYTLAVRHPGLRQRGGRARLSVGVARPVAPLAAWWHEAQELELPVSIDAGSGGAVRLRAWTSHPDWRAEVPASVTTSPGQRATAQLRLHVAPDASSDIPVRVVVEATSVDGSRAVGSTELSAACGAPAVGAHAARLLPPTLLGGLDVASAALGGTVQPVAAFQGRDQHLLQGLVTLDRDFYAGSDKLPFDLTFDLAGDAPVEVAGVLLHPPGAMVRQGFNSLRDFEVLLSSDGTTFTPALTGALEEVVAEQAFVLPAPVSARFARLRFKSEWKGRGSHVGLATFKVIATPGSTPDVARAGLNLADPAAGGHVVWADGRLQDPRAMLTAEKERPTFRSEPTGDAAFVIGFNHQRAMRLRALEWQESTEPGSTTCAVDAARVEVSVDSPLGPWAPLATWRLARDPQGLARLELPAPQWARYVKFSLPPAGLERIYCRLPETLRLFEQPPDTQYRSAVGEWGVARREAFFELQREKAAPPPRAPTAAHATAQTAAALGLDTSHVDTVDRGVDEDWYRIDIPEGMNTLTLTLTSNEPSRLEYRLATADGKPVKLAGKPASGAGLQLRAEVEPKQSYLLRIGEPLRSIVFAWDSSGSVAEFHPQIYQALARFSAAVRPEREQVHLLPFGSAQPLTATWARDSHSLMTAIANYDERDGSSDAEGALRQSSELLADATGSRAVMTVTDDESGASVDDEAKLWTSLHDVRPRVFAVQIPLGSQPHLYQDRMQTWARVNDGHHGTFRTREDLALSFDRATCLLRRPVEYAVTAKATHELPPAPGSVAVRMQPQGTALELIYDASGSMYQKLGSSTRLQVAREVISGLATRSIPPGTPVALRAYGHLLPRRCKTELVVPLSPHDPSRLAALIRRIEPKDRSGTPIAESLAAVAEDLRSAGRQKVVVLVTDGEESCGGDPGAAIEALKAKGIDVRLNIVGFAVSEQGKRGFARWAEAGGGRFFEAANREELARAMEEALNPGFQVLDGSGALVASGTVNGKPVDVPPGDYSVRILSSPPEVVSGVRVESARVKLLER